MVCKTKIVRASVCAVLLWSATTLAEDRVTAGAASVEPPTLISLGFDWAITGDDNRNAAVTVEYRETGATDWHVGLPLMRLMNEQVNGRVGGPSFLPGTNAVESAATSRVARRRLRSPGPARIRSRSVRSRTSRRTCSRAACST